MDDHQRRRDRDHAGPRRPVEARHRTGRRYRAGQKSAFIGEPLQVGTIDRMISAL
jgi:hypothetical protein